MEDPDETSLKYIRHYYHTVLKYLHREYIKIQPECVQSLLNEIRKLTNREKNEMILSSFGKITFDNIHEYYSGILNKLETEINHKTDDISQVITDSLAYKLNLPSHQMEETEMTLLKSVQEHQRLDELEGLRIKEAELDLLNYFLQFLFTDKNDIFTLVKILHQNVIVLEQNDLKSLLNFILTEKISFNLFKEYYHTIQNVISFLKQDMTLTFLPEDVDSLISLLNEFGGQAFVQSLKDIILLKKSYPEYETLLGVFNDLKRNYSSDKIIHFVSVLQLVFKIHKLFPEENDIERLKYGFLDHVMMEKYDINLKQLTGLLTQEKIKKTMFEAEAGEIEGKRAKIAKYEEGEEK